MRISYPAAAALTAALLFGIDPTPVGPITALKSRIQSTSFP